MAKHRTTDSLARSGYIVSDAALAAIAREYVDVRGKVNEVRGTYLRVLVAHTQKALAEQKMKRPSTANALEALESVHAHFYPVILDAITTKDVMVVPGLEDTERSRRALERNRRSTFARTAKSVLSNWIRNGGKVEKLVPADVRKDELQKTYQPARSQKKSLAERASRVEKKLESLVKRMVDKDAQAAERFVEMIQQRLAGLVGGKVKPVTTKRKRVGDIILHPHH